MLPNSLFKNQKMQLDWQPLLKTYVTLNKQLSTYLQLQLEQILEYEFNPIISDLLLIIIVYLQLKLVLKSMKYFLGHFIMLFKFLLMVVVFVGGVFGVLWYRPEVVKMALMAMQN